MKSPREQLGTGGSVVRPRVRRGRNSNKITGQLLKIFSSREAFQSFDFRALLRRLEAASRRNVKVVVKHPLTHRKKRA